MGVLDHAADWFKARQTGIQSWYEDDEGRYAFRVTVDGQPFIVSAKESKYQGQASFMSKKVVQRAIDADVLLLQFVDGDRLVFDPQYVDQFGDHRTADEARKKRGESWVDIDTDPSVTFETWYDRREQPDSPDDHVPTGITDWGKYD